MSHCGNNGGGGVGDERVEGGACLLLAENGAMDNDYDVVKLPVEGNGVGVGVGRSSGGEDSDRRRGGGVGDGERGKEARGEREQSTVMQPGMMDDDNGSFCRSRPFDLVVVDMGSLGGLELAQKLVS